MCIQNLDKSEIRWSQLYRLAVPGIKITVGGFFAPWLIRNGEVSGFEACGRGYGDGTKRDLHDRVAVSLEAIACCWTFGSDYFTVFCSGDNDEDQDEEPGCESESKCERHDAVTSSE